MTCRRYRHNISKISSLALHRTASLTREGMSSLVLVLFLRGLDYLPWAMQMGSSVEVPATINRDLRLHKGSQITPPLTGQVNTLMFHLELGHCNQHRAQTVYHPTQYQSALD